MTEYITTDTELTDVADAIRTKGGTSASLEWPDGFVDAIGAISGGGGGGGGTRYEIAHSGNYRPMVSEGATVYGKTPSAAPAKNGYTVNVAEVSSGTVVFNQSGMAKDTEYQFTMPAAEVRITITNL